MTALRSTQVKAHAHKSMTMVMIRKKKGMWSLSNSACLWWLLNCWQWNHTSFIIHTHMYFNWQCSHVSVWPLWQLRCPWADHSHSLIALLKIYLFRVIEGWREGGTAGKGGGGGGRKRRDERGMEEGTEGGRKGRERGEEWRWWKGRRGGKRTESSLSSLNPSLHLSPGVKNGGRGREKYERREELYPTTGLYLHMIFTANTRASLIPGSLEPRPRSLGTRLNTVMLYGAHLFCLFHAKP